MLLYFPAAAPTPPNTPADLSTHSRKGVPPWSLLMSHPDARLLRSIPARTDRLLSPQWLLPGQELTSLLLTYGWTYGPIVVSHALKLAFAPVLKAANTT